MNQKILSKARGVVRRLISLPLQIAPRGIRAEALERLSAQMVVDTPVPGGIIHFHTPSLMLQDRALTVMDKEPDMIPWLDGLPAGSTLWDIGANVGVFSLYAAVSRKCRVISFEPSAANFHVLARNVSLNPGADVTPYCLALSGTSGLGTLNLATAELGASMAHFGNAGEVNRYWQHGYTGYSHGMIGMTIDEFISAFSPPFPDFIKIDVDGLEWPILQGASDTFSDPRMKSAMIELSVSDHHERTQAISWLEERGLHLASQGAEQGTATEKAANHLFVRS